MTDSTNEHRERARAIIEREAGVPFDCPSVEAEFRNNCNLERLTNNVACGLSSRDAEIKEVLEGFRGRLLKQDCWCDEVVKGHTELCLAARALYAKLNSEAPAPTNTTPKRRRKSKRELLAEELRESDVTGQDRTDIVYGPHDSLPPCGEHVARMKRG